MQPDTLQPEASREQGVDLISLEVFRHRLQGMVDEMQLTQVRSSLSTAVKEASDAATSLFLADGRVISQGRSIPFHLGTLVPTVEHMLARFPASSMREDDVYLLNDPFVGGGSHLPDIVVFIPIFAEGRMVALSGSVVHHSDVGGIVAGSGPINSTEIFQEGLRIPPTLYSRGGQINQGVQEIMLLNSRTPDLLLGDLNGQIGACKVGVRRVLEFIAEEGVALFLESSEALISFSSRRVRQELRDLPEGTYTAEDDLDNDGVDLDRRVHIKVTVTLKDGTMHVDYTGTSAQTAGPINIVPSAAQAAAYYALRCLVDPTIPSNAGCFEPVSLHLPPGSLVNPRPPAAVNARNSSTRRLASTILAALRPAMPSRLPAEGATLMLNMRYVWSDKDGRTHVSGDHVVGGTGASLHRDGVDAMCADIGNMTSVPVESIEFDAPIRILKQGIRENSGGDGRTRGGNGIIREMEVLSENLRFLHRGERHYVPAHGCEGGKDGALSKSAVHRRSGAVETIPAKATIDLLRGDRVVLETAGGGGWGNPAERSEALVEADRAAGKFHR